MRVPPLDKNQSEKLICNKSTNWLKEQVWTLRKMTDKQNQYKEKQ